jgi:dihydroneopterin aldolase/2-amino-4-hydroxy-6-hydroxymethyldihydropteridine diphosphokinase
LAGERIKPQRFVVDLTAWLPPVTDRSDELGATVDYSLFSALIVDTIKQESYQLIETLADRIARSALDLGGIEQVEVTVHKPAAPLAEPFADVTVTTRRRLRTSSRRVVFSLGSNLGDRLAWIQFGLTGLVTTPDVRFVAVSPVYETRPVGVVGQPDYLNATLVVESIRPAEQLLNRGLGLERLAGRVRPAGQTPQHGARPLDVDLIVAGDETSATDHLTLPHPRAHRRAFVLAPWLEADPTARLAGRPLEEWLERITDQPVWRRGDLRLTVPARSTD